MKPPNGNYRLKANPNPPGKPDMRLEIRGDSISGFTGQATCAQFVWESGVDAFVVLKVPAPPPPANPVHIAIRFLTATEFVATQDPGTPQEKSWTGTYAPESP